MASTKINFYIYVIAIFFIGCISLLLLNTEMRHATGVTLDNKSIAYIDTYALNYGDVDNGTVVNVSVKSLKDDGIISGESENGTTSSNDIFAQLNYAKQKAKKFTDYLFAVYNMPSFFIATLGLPVGQFQHVINILGVVLFISFVVLIIRFIRGS